jgi:2-dehydropantoate 2-reductase
MCSFAFAIWEMVMTESANRNDLRVGVIGMGPVGSTLAAHLIDAGAFVVACDVDRTRIDAIKSGGIRLENKLEKQVSVPETCYSVVELGNYNLDLVAIATKAPALKKIASLLTEAVPSHVCIVCAQNGLDNEREVASAVGEDRTLRMVVNYAGVMSTPNTVNVTFFNAPNYVAALSSGTGEMARRVADLLNLSGLATEIPDNIRKYTWEKAILNAALAPVCAITRLTMKQVMEEPEAVEIVKGIIDESVRVAELDGVQYGEGFGEFCLEYLKKGGDHRPSMAVDLENGFETEIDYINGKIAEFGYQHGLPTPLNRTITTMVHMLERAGND